MYAASHELRFKLNGGVLDSRITYYVRASKVVSHLLAHIDQPMDLKDAARIACMERTAFSKFFARSIGVSFKQFTLSVRIKRAIQYMSESDMSLTEIADAVGFEALGTFERVFKKMNGDTPSSFRKRLLAEKHGRALDR